MLRQLCSSNRGLLSGLVDIFFTSNLCPQNLFFSWHLLCPMYNFLCLRHSAAYITFFVRQVPPCFTSNFFLFRLFVILFDAAIEEHSLQLP